jgi:hypothetical protein
MPGRHRGIYTGKHTEQHAKDKNFDPRKKLKSEPVKKKTKLTPSDTD